jgi:hypothetical protein
MSTQNIAAPTSPVVIDLGVTPRATVALAEVPYDAALQNAEELRPRFVAHAGKVRLEVRRDEFIKGSPANDWSDVFGEFSGQIRKHLGDATYDLLLPRFSTTGATEIAVAQVVLLDAMQSYFEYRAMTLCGIPEIVLEGTADDWQQLTRRTRHLGRFGLTWWTSVLELVLKEFVAAVRGHANANFWRSIYKIDDSSGGRISMAGSLPSSRIWWVTLRFWIRSTKTNSYGIRRGDGGCALRKRTPC